MASYVSLLLVFLCRSSYLVTLPWLKVPFALCVRASRAKHVFAFISLCVVPCYPITRGPTQSCDRRTAGDAQRCTSTVGAMIPDPVW